MADKRTASKRIAALIAVCGFIFFLVPWSSLVEKRLITVLEAQGMKAVRLQVTSVGFSSLTLRNLSIGEKDPLTLHHLTVEYSLLDLWHGHIKSLTLSDLTLAAARQKTGWTITGLTLFNVSGDGQDILIPVRADAFPLEQATLKDSHLQMDAGSLHADIPLNFTWKKLPTSMADYSGSGMVLRMGGIRAAFAESMLHAALFEPEKIWKGLWSVKNIVFKGIPVDIPVSEASGTLSAKADQFDLQGVWSGGQFKAIFNLRYMLTAPERSRFTLTSFSMPWNGGTVSLRDAVIAFSGTGDYHIPVTIRSVSLNALLQPLTGKRAKATGTVSGLLPLDLHADGTFGVTAGALNAETPGIITMPADAIPGDNAQIALLRNLLTDFHYQQLQLAVDSGKNDTLSLLLTLQGNNPSVYDGRQVKLQVHLGGDVLDFITQNMTLSDPKTFLNQSRDAK